MCQASYKKYRGDVLLPVDFVQLTESGDSAGNFIRISSEMRKRRLSRLFAIDIALTELLEYFSLPKQQIMQKYKSTIWKNQLFTIDTGDLAGKFTCTSASLGFSPTALRRAPSN